MTTREEHKKLNRLWHLASKYRRHIAPVRLQAPAIAALLRAARAERDQVKGELMAAPDAQEQLAAIAMTLADHWTCDAIAQLKEANGKRQIQQWVRAHNTAVAYERVCLGEEGGA